MTRAKHLIIKRTRLLGLESYRTSEIEPFSQFVSSKTLLVKRRSKAKHLFLKSFIFHYKIKYNKMIEKNVFGLDTIVDGSVSGICENHKRQLRWYQRIIFFGVGIILMAVSVVFVKNHKRQLRWQQNFQRKRTRRHLMGV